MGRCRGPVRGPSHLCNQCAQGHRRHGFAVFVQLARTMYETVLLIIRRSWVRAPPAAPLCETVALPPPSRSCRRGFVVSGEQEDGLVGGLELRIPQGVGDCGTSRAAFSGSSARSRVPSGPSASLSSTSRLSAQLYRYRTRLGCSPANRTYPGPVGRGAHGRVPSFAWLSGGSMERGSSKAQRASRRADEAGGTGHGARDRRRPRRRMEDGRTGRQGQLEPTPTVDTGTADDLSRFGRFIGPSALPGDRDALRRSAETLEAPNDVLADLDSVPQASPTAPSPRSGPHSAAARPGGRQGLRTTFSQSSCLFLKISKPRSASSSGRVWVMTRVGSISPRSMRCSSGFI